MNEMQATTTAAANGAASADENVLLLPVRQILDRVFAARELSDSVELSNAGSAALGLSRSGLTYGETELPSLLRVLRLAELPSYCCACTSGRAAPHLRCAHCGRRPAGAAIFDLGSGMGNVVAAVAAMAAARLISVHAVRGVELLPTLHSASRDSLAELRLLCAHPDTVLPVPLPPCGVVCADLTNFDISDADVIYMCCTAFRAETLRTWSVHAAATLRPGSRVITISKPLTHAAFALERTVACEASWGPETAYVHRVRPVALPPLSPLGALAARLVLTTSHGGGSAWAFAAFDVRKVAGKGRGAFATEAVPKGARLMAEAPLAVWIVPDRQKVRGEDALTMVHDVVRSLDDTKRRAYFSLQQLPDGDLAGLPGSAEAAAGVWMTNAYPTSHAATDDGAGDGQAVFELISRLNHDCHPNTHLSWNAELGKQTCHAARKVE